VRKKEDVCMNFPRDGRYLARPFQRMVKIVYNGDTNRLLVTAKELHCDGA